MEEKMTISLSTSQRKLLLKYESEFSDTQLFRLVAVAVKKGNKYEITLEADQLEELLDQVSDLSNEEENEGLQSQLDALCDYLGQFSDEIGEEDYTANSKNAGSVCIVKVDIAYEGDIWRRIAIREGQTLHDLNNTIFDAFDREEEHMYSFFFPHSPTKKLDPRRIYNSSDEYTHPYACQEQGIFGTEAQDASRTSIESLALTEGQVFYYLFDFGDEWWHRITVEQIEQIPDDEKYPRIIEKKGKSPAQYPDLDEEEG